MNNNINIRDYVKKDISILRGRDKGEIARRQARLNDLDQTDEEITVIFDNDFKSLNTSFFLGMFEDSIKHFKRDKFRIKYNFKCKDSFSKKIDVCIDSVMKKLEN